MPELPASIYVVELMFLLKSVENSAGHKINLKMHFHVLAPHIIPETIHILCGISDNFTHSYDRLFLTEKINQKHSCIENKSQNIIECFRSLLKKISSFKDPCESF